MDTITPNFRLTVKLEGRELSDRVRELLALASKIGLPAVQGIRSPITGPIRPTNQLEKLLKGADAVMLDCGEAVQLAISAYPQTPGVLVQLNWITGGQSDTVGPAAKSCAQLLRILFETGRIIEGSAGRLEPSLTAVPRVPIAEYNIVVATTKDAVNSAYADPRAFWKAWSHTAENAGRILLERGLDSITTEEWFRAIYDLQWSMARAARPGMTAYGRVQYPPGAQDLFKAGKSYLSQVGYLKDAAVLELAAYVPEKAHIPGWEILKWRETLKKGQLEPGKPIKTVRVVFRNEIMARREGTPLMDIGAEVWYMGKDGLDHRLD